jgi:hypothetical protein
MTPSQKNILLGMITRIGNIIDVQEEFFFKERPFLMAGTKAEIIPLSEDDQRKADQAERDFKAVTKAYIDFYNKLFPMKQGELC